MSKHSIMWGVLGLGDIAVKFIHDFSFVRNATIKAVATHSGKNVSEAVSALPNVTVFRSYEELAKDQSLDVVYVATPHTLHYENCLLLIEHGKHVLCEKPIAINRKQLEFLIRKADENKCFLMEAMWSRFTPGFLKLNEYLETGSLGKIYRIEATIGFDAYQKGLARLFDPQLGGGALLDIGIYPVWLGIWLFDEIPEVEVCSQKYSASKIDEAVTVRLHFKQQKCELIFTCSIAEKLENVCTFTGSRNPITLGKPWWHGRSFPGSPSISYAGTGLHYQVSEVNRCIQQGKLQSDKHTLATSLKTLETLDRIRGQMESFKV